MKQYLRPLASALIAPPARLLVRMRLRAAMPVASPAARRLLSTVVATLGTVPQGPAGMAIARIEKLRGELAASGETVALVDYGAGGPNDTRSAEEMRQGRRVESTIGAVCRMASKPPFWARLLFNVVHEYRPERGVELGTCLGISAAYQGTAMKAAGRGRLYTLEGAESLATLSQRNLGVLGLDNVTVVAGRFDQTLDSVLKQQGPLDYAFIDGHHDEQATVEYFRKLLPCLSPGALLVFDDITWSPGMRRAWQAICADPRVRVAVDLRAVGLCLVDVESVPMARYRYWLP